MIIKLRKSYPCIHGLPVIHSVDTDIFELTYFMHCMQCSFCNDQCCSYGANIDMLNVERIMRNADDIEKYTGIKREHWFSLKNKGWDYEYPGHYFTRTTSHNGACVFLNRNGRGCMLHSYADEKDLDYHLFKPFFCSVFPVTYLDGVLVTPEEIDENTLICLGKGPGLYSGARKALKYYFGSEMVEETDEIEKQFLKERKNA